jgi:16S rRNA processing protein RimM
MVILGRIAGPYGIKGWVKVQPFGDDPLRWREMPCWWLAPTQTDAWQCLTLEHFRAQGSHLVAAFVGVTDRHAAQALQGFLIGAPRENLPRVADNEFYWDDLIGMTVVNAENESLGTVAGLIETGANDVLRVVDAEGVERLLPFVEAVVRKVDLSLRRIDVLWSLEW